MADSVNELFAANDTTVKAMIIPGTTPSLVITVDESILTDSSKARIDIVQGNNVLLQVNGTIEKSSIIYNLSQDETYLFKQGTIKVQVHGLMKDNTAWKTQVFTIDVGETLTTTVIS